MPAVVEKEYVTHLDAKNRFTLRGAKTKLYAVKVFDDGHCLLSPQKIVDDPPISAKTMRQIERSMKNLKEGNVGSSVNI